MNDIDWGMVGGVAGVAALLVAIWIAWFQTKRKVIEYTVYRSELASVEKSIAKRIKIVFDGHDVESVESTVFALRNTGNAAVAATDYDQPITLKLDPGQLLLGATLSLPEEDETQLPLEGDLLTLPGILLNPGEQGSVTLIVAPSWRNTPRPHARIIDGKFRQSATISNKTVQRADLLFGLAIMVSALGTGVLTTVVDLFPYPYGHVALFLLVLAMGALMVERWFRISRG